MTERDMDAGVLTMIQEVCAEAARQAALIQSDMTLYGAAYIGPDGRRIDPAVARGTDIEWVPAKVREMYATSGPGWPD